MRGGAHTGSVLPPAVGIGWRPAHYTDLLEQRPKLAFIEIHPENYLGGGTPRRMIEKARRDYPLSFHSVGMSLGSSEGINLAHVDAIAQLARDLEPAMISDHLAWSASGNAHLNDLLPLPYNDETLAIVCSNIERAQERLGRAMLIENPATYLEFMHSSMSEPEFIDKLLNRTGCGLLLDLNNVYVQSMNHGFDALSYIDMLPAASIRELHLGGHSIRHFSGGSLLIDTHDEQVSAQVWKLFAYAIRRFGKLPTLIEWDAQLPDFRLLLAQVELASAVMEQELPHAAA